MKDFERQQQLQTDERNLKERLAAAQHKKMSRENLPAANLFEEEPLKNNMGLRISEAEFNPKDFFTLPIPKTSKLYSRTDKGAHLGVGGLFLTALAQSKMKSGANWKARKQESVMCGIIEKESEVEPVPTIDKLKERLDQIRSIMGKDIPETSSPTSSSPRTQFTKQYSLRDIRSSEGGSRGSSRQGSTKRSESLLIKRRGHRLEGEKYIHSLITND